MNQSIGRSLQLWRNLRKGTLASQRRFYRRERIVNEPIRATDILYSLLRLRNTMKVILWEGREVLNIFRTADWKSLIKRKILHKKLFWFHNIEEWHWYNLKDHKPENNFWTPRFLLSDRITIFHSPFMLKMFIYNCRKMYVWLFSNFCI